MANSKIQKLKLEIQDLAEKATYYGNQIVFFKAHITCDPLHTDKKYEWNDNWESTLPMNQHYYAYYLFYRDALKRVEKEISKRKKYLKIEQQKASLPVRKTVKN